MWLRSLYGRDVEQLLVELKSLYCRDVEQLLVERGARGLEREALQGPELSLCLLHTLISRFAAPKNLFVKACTFYLARLLAAGKEKRTCLLLLEFIF